jgi:virginiamycin B lyase
MALAAGAVAGGVWGCGSSVKACAQGAEECADSVDAADASEDSPVVEATLPEAGDDAIADDPDGGTDESDATSPPDGPSDDAAEDSSPEEAQVVAKGLAFTATQGLQVIGPMALLTDAVPSDSSASLSAVIDWGDKGPTSYGTVSGSSGSFSIAGSHTYASSGEFTVTLTVSASGGAQATTDFKGTVQPPVTITGFTIPTSASAPSFITSGPDGALWFAENAKIGRVTTSGMFEEFVIPTPNAAPGTITSGPDGNLWFCESNTDKIGRVTTAGVITEFAVTKGSGPGGITAGPDGNLWFTELTGNKIGEMAPNGTLINEFAIATSASLPFGIAPGPDGNLWFGEYGGNNIGRMTTSGVLREFPTAPDSGPGTISVGPDANLWFVETKSSDIGHVTTEGIATTFGVPAPDENPLRLCTGPDGNLWFTFENSTSQLGRMTPRGAFTEFPIASAGDVVAGPDGNLWFTDTADNQIVRLMLTP